MSADDTGEREDWGEYLSPLWKEQRTEYLGCSEVAAVLGMSPYAGPWEVAARKCGKLPEKETSLAMELGTLIEPVILKLWQRYSTGFADYRRPVWTLQHPDIPCLGASLDGIGIRESGEEVVLEFKHLHWRIKDDLATFRDEGRIVGGLLPYWIQVQAQLAVTGLASAQLVVLHEKLLDILDVPRDDVAVARIETEIPAFWARFIEGDEEPKPSAQDGAAVKAIYPEATPGTVLHKPELAADVESIRGLKAELKRISGEAKPVKTRIKELEAGIMAEMGEHETLTLGDGIWPATWKTTQRKGYSVGPKTFRTLKV